MPPGADDFKFVVREAGRVIGHKIVDKIESRDQSVANLKVIRFEEHLPIVV